MRRLIFILVITNFFFSCNDDLNKRKHRNNKTNISEIDTKSLQKSIIGKWKIKKIIFQESGNNPSNRSSRTNFICELYSGKQIDSVMLIFLPNNDLKINEDKKGIWRINKDGKLVIEGTDIYLDNFPIFKDIPLHIGQDNYYKYLTANFKSEAKGIGHKIIFCLNKID